MVDCSECRLLRNIEVGHIKVIRHEMVDSIYAKLINHFMFTSNTDDLHHVASCSWYHLIDIIERKSRNLEIQ